MQCSQNKDVYRNINLERKLLKCNVNINFNKERLKHHIVPHYVKTKHHNMKMRTKIQKTHIKHEIQLLYNKNQQIDEQIHKTHIHFANHWKKLDKH